MRLKGVALDVVEELRRRDIEMSYEVVRLVIQLCLEVVKEETSKGGRVLLDDFATLTPVIRTLSGSTYWSIGLKKSLSWRTACHIKKGETPVAIEKYNYEKDQKDPTVKTASEKGRCPQCGAELKGAPPVCPNHGSEPFERRPDGEKEEG